MDRLLLRIFGKILFVLDRIGIHIGRNNRPKTGHPYKDIDPRQMWARRYLSWRFLRGSGIEIGALHLPLPLYHGATVEYVDNLSVADAKKHYPELNDFDLVTPTYIENGELLPSVANGSRDFIVANHFIEHCENPISTLGVLLDKLRVGGKIFLAVPMRDFTFDRDRPLTALQHLINDYREGAAGSHKEHFREWVTYVEKVDGSQIENRAEKLDQEHYSIHFHVWNYGSFLEFLIAASKELKKPFEVVSAVAWKFNPFEAVYILRKD